MNLQLCFCFNPKVLNCQAKCNDSDLYTSYGVRYPKHFLGRLFILENISWTSSWLYLLKSCPLEDILLSVHLCFHLFAMDDAA